jgi:hypothetical protein
MISCMFPCQQSGAPEPLANISILNHRPSPAMLSAANIAMLI